jgi:hypothetical protein
MKPLHALGSLALFIGLMTGIPAVCWTQQLAAPAALPNGSGALTDEEEQAFEARLRAASTDEMRARIERERDDIIQVRILQRGLVQIIPPSRYELSDDLVMPDVPTPPLDRPRAPGTLPGGALAPMGAGTSPAGGSDTSP